MLRLTFPQHPASLFPPLKKRSAGRENPSIRKASKRLYLAFFYAQNLSMAGDAWARFGAAGPLASRFLTLCVVRRPSAVRSGRDGSKSNRKESVMANHVPGQNPPAVSLNTAMSAGPADLIPITSPVVERLPELLDVHRLAIHIHRSLLETGADLPAILSGWILAEAEGHLAEARRALEAVSETVAKGVRDHG
ncbi:hypothetical protein [Methylocaldum sp.]|uniref:hypothetical protein n=1 Tax=Methylocaldum sp. TaxID=1969727 RepID=UPI002D24D253|nr:hypothetical protein [Methylocaldum sp.]HYE35390.1 hypothetical protein [Methylocaldum sp.]